MARKKSNSRASRASRAAQGFRDVASRLSDLLGEEEKTDAGKVDEANGILGDIDISELENLKEEMASWRDSMSDHPGLAATSKFETVSSTADTLESIDISTTSVSDKDEIQSAIDELESAADELEGCEFPGMFG